MPRYSSKENILHGVPLGGMGTGKIEILPTGVFDAFTFLNNWTAPLKGVPNQGLLGFHLGAASKNTAYLLQTSPVADLPCVPSVVYEGHFAQAQLDYRTPGLGLEVRLKADSPWVPTDADNSSLPLVYFEICVKNTSPVTREASLLWMARNLCGDWCVGRQNRVLENENYLDLSMKNDFSAGWDLKCGEIRFRFEKKGWQTSFLECWNAVTKNFSFTPADMALSAWEAFSKHGCLPNARSPEPIAEGENREFCAAVAAKTLLRPGEERRWRVAMGWVFSDARMPHAYSVRMDSAEKVLDHAVAHRPLLQKKSDRFRTLALSLPFPAWFNEALLTNLTPFQGATRHLKDGRFAFYEAPEICPLLGTMDVGFYGSIPLSYFFPELEISQILQFARFQREDGYIPHDLGRNRLDQPSNGTTFFKWKDLNPKFVLMAYRDYLWSGRKTAFLNQIYPHVKRAIRWVLERDLDKNGLPDHEGADQTFDLWSFRGPCAYTAGLFLAALLAGEKMAGLRGDDSFSGECLRAYRLGRGTFENVLWNGRFFGDDFSALCQLNGQWYADLLGLGEVADPAKIQKAIRFCLRHHVRYSRFGMVNSVLPDGKPDRSNDHAKNVWAGMNYAFLCLAMTRGFSLTNLLKEAHKLWNNIAYLQKSPWSQPDTVDAKTGHYIFGDFYYRNMAIWSIPIAHAMRDKKTAMILRQMKQLNSLQAR